MRLIMLTLLCFGLVSTAAQAHAILIDSTPAPLAHVAAGHLAVVLRYNSRIDAPRSKLELQHGDALVRLAIEHSTAPDLLKAGVDVAPGDYTLRWQVLATDGHITRGTVPFSVDAASH